MLSLTLTDPLAPDAAPRRIRVDTLPVTLGGAPDSDIVLDDTSLAGWTGTLQRKRSGHLWLSGKSAVLRTQDDAPAYSELEIRPGHALHIGRLHVLPETADDQPAAGGPPARRWNALRAPFAVVLLLSAVFADIWFKANGTPQPDALLSNLLSMASILAVLLLMALCIDKLIGRSFDATATLVRLAGVSVALIAATNALDLASFAWGFQPLNVSDSTTAVLWLIALVLALLWPSRSLLRRWRRSRNLIPVVSVVVLIAGSGTVMALRDTDRNRQTPIGNTYAPSLRLTTPEDGAQVLDELRQMREGMEQMRREAPPVPSDD